MCMANHPIKVNQHNTRVVQILYHMNGNGENTEAVCFIIPLSNKLNYLFLISLSPSFIFKIHHGMPVFVVCVCSSMCSCIFHIPWDGVSKIYFSNNTYSLNIHTSIALLFPFQVSNIIACPFQHTVFLCGIYFFIKYNIDTVPSHVCLFDGDFPHDL